MASTFAHRLPLFPESAKITSNNQLTLGGLNAADLAAEFGTPLYVYDEATLRSQCRGFKQEFGARYPDVRVSYASKAFMVRPLANLLKAEGMGLDVVSGGELAVAMGVDFPKGGVYFHGNNKGGDELEMALEWRVGRVVVDNFHELLLLNALAGEARVKQDILLRVSPGVDPHTHSHTTTGILDSKFGFALDNGQAEEAVRQASKMANLRLMGLHCHLGSPIFELEPFTQGIEVMMGFAAHMKKRHGLQMEEFSPGGGFAIQYLIEKPAPAIAQYAETITTALKKSCAHFALDLPRLVIEPGRSIVGRAGVALYTVGAAKDIPGVRKYVSVDGGMGDNIRPAIYGAQYEALVANRVEDAATEKVTIAGKYCESGDILIKDIDMPALRAGDVIAIPASGAYCIPMSSNYNAAPKPPIVLVSNGDVRLWRRRETYSDLMQCDAEG